MRYFFMLFLITGITACWRKKTQVQVFKASSFIVVDSVSIPDAFFKPDDHYSGYPIYYNGRLTDTIAIGDVYRNHVMQRLDGYYNRFYNNKTLRLFVDTSVISSTRVEYGRYDTSAIIIDSTKFFSSWLLTVENISDSALYMGRTRSLFFMWREAKNSKGDWVKIEKHMGDLGLCLSSQPVTYLKPHEIILSKVKRYKGDYITDCRLVFGRGNNLAYSNTFRDAVSDSTFDMKELSR